MSAAIDTGAVAPGRDTPAELLRAHWPEYLIEGWALGMFMVSAAVVATLLEGPGGTLHRAIGPDALRRVFGGIAMGLTAIALIQSPWGKRSGAHMNPAVTLAFLRLGTIRPLDALFYVLAQFAGGTLGVLAAAAVLGDAFALPPVRFAATLPGPAGVPVAFVAELAISTLMMLTVLTVSSSRHAAWTGVCAGVLVASFISIEGPLSGMSMNPARSFASAFSAGAWSSFWVYVIAPLLGMQLGVAIHLRRGRARGCAKLLHTADQRCIHCGYEPRADEVTP